VPAPKGWRVKIPKQAAKLHNQALALTRESRRLTLDERAFVLAHFHEGAQHMNGLAGAFFTPPGLARDFALEVCGRRVLDLCAGIGMLSDAADNGERSFVCVERNPDYVEVGRQAMPDATWVCASAFDLDAFAHLGPFDCVISNPPFGQVPAEGYVGTYTGSRFEYRVVETASRLAPYGVFIVPQMSAPFRYSGQTCFRKDEDEACRRFREQTGIRMEPNCGIDTAAYRGEWKGVSPLCEIVCCDFLERDAAATTPNVPAPSKAQMALFGGAP
jgi:SAM-dependent methyltransferase